jgi:GTP-binding protein
MSIKTAEFIISNTDPEKCPSPDKPEYAFIGRSNVGKSSLINMLTGNKKLAKISSQPGKTRLINHFKINNEWYLVDLPGYGYAKTMRNQRRKWFSFIREYMKTRANLYCVMVLIDSRIEAQALDIEFMSWLGENSVPFVMVFTKVDKLGQGQLDKKLAAYKKEMLKMWEELPRIFVTSSETGKGKEELIDFIESVNSDSK